MALRCLLAGCLLALASCGSDEAAQQKNAELKAEVDRLKAENAHKEAREAALMEQLENEAAEKVELIRELERVKPMVDRVEAAERRVEEVEEMIKEVKKLE